MQSIGVKKKKIDLGQAITVLANVGVIAGLIFVGLQLKQDRELARIDGRLAVAGQHKYWAELVSSNQTIWHEGLSREPLTAAEYKTFDALARARDFQLYMNWANSQSGSFELVDVQRVKFSQSFVREAALEFFSNPGLIDWYERYQDFLQEVGRYEEYEDLVSTEIRRLRDEPND